MSEKWCYMNNCDAPDEQIGICDSCGADVCEHHAVILGENDWRCMPCAEVKQAAPLGGLAFTLAVCAMGIVATVMVNWDWIIFQWRKV